MPLKDQGKLDEAVACYRRALAAETGLCRGAQQPGHRLAGPGKAGRSGRLLPPGLELKPDYAEAHNNLGTAFKDQGKLDEASPAIAGHWN